MNVPAMKQTARNTTSGTTLSKPVTSNPSFQHPFVRSEWHRTISERCMCPLIGAEYSTHGRYLYIVWPTRCKMQDLRASPVCYTSGRFHICNTVTLRDGSVSSESVTLAPLCAAPRIWTSPPFLVFLQLLSYGLFQESKEISTDDFNHISFTISPGQEFCGKLYQMLVPLYAIVLQMGPGFREICHLITKIKTNSHVISPYQIANMIHMVGQIFLI